MNYLGDIVGATSGNDVALRIFWGIGFVGLGLILLQGMLGFVMGHDGDSDSGSGLDLHGHGGGSYLSLKSISALLIGVGFGGAMLGEWGCPAFVAVLGGLGIGLVFAVFFIALMRFFHRLGSDGTARLYEAIGQRATVYMRIPAEEAAPGEVQVAFGGRLMNIPAYTRGPELPTGTEVLVVFTHGEHALIVEKITDEPLTLN